MYGNAGLLLTATRRLHCSLPVLLATTLDRTALGRPGHRSRHRHAPRPTSAAQSGIRKALRGSYRPADASIRKDSDQWRHLVSGRSLVRAERVPAGRRGGVHLDVSPRHPSSRAPVADRPYSFSLSWSDTTASVFGRMFGAQSPKLPAHVPGLPFLPFAKRKSLAGFLAAAVTGFGIAAGFWWNGTHPLGGDNGHWQFLDGLTTRKGPLSFITLQPLGKPLGLWLTALILGVGGATVEAIGEYPPHRHLMTIADSMR